MSVFVTSHMRSPRNMDALCSKPAVSSLTKYLTEPLLSESDKRLFCERNRLISQAASSPVFIKVLMSAPKKRLHRANKRNRAKRLMREAYRLQKHALWQQISTMKSENGVPMRMELAFVWLAEETLPYAKVYERMGRLLEKIQASLS